MSSIDTLAKRVKDKGGDLDIQYRRGDTIGLDYWVINITTLTPPFFDSMTYQSVVGGAGDSLTKVANKANGAIK